MQSSHRPPFALSDLINPRTTELNLRGSSRDAVLTELIDKIPELAGQPEAKATLLRALKEREQLHSTGIGDGIALPHARNALVVNGSVLDIDIFGSGPQSSSSWPASFASNIREQFTT